MMERELKYILPNNAKRSLIDSLYFTCVLDKDHAVNKVNSLYFDTHDHLFAMDKASSDYNKSKVRIRWYTNSQKSQTSMCFLEIKHKIGSTRKKIRIPLAIGPESVYEIWHSGQLTPLIQPLINQHCSDIAHLNLKPFFTVEYDRHRFLDPFSGCRIACDTDIISKPFQLGAPFVLNQIKLEETVLEVKGQSHVLPTALRSLSIKGLKKAAFSKYYESYCHLTDYQQ